MPAHAQGEPEPAFDTPLANAKDQTAAGLAFVELVSERPGYVLGEPIELRLRFGFERGFLAQNLVQLFQRPLEVPAQVFAPAFEAHAGLVFEQALADGVDPAAGASFALGERILRARALADETRAGRSFAVFELVRRARAVRPGTLELAAPVLGFAHATRFEDDFLHGKRALDREEALVRGATLELTILPPPEAERPAEYTGAVGRFRIEVTATPQDLVLGQALELRLRIESEQGGALQAGMEPRLEGLAGFHVQGQLVESDAQGLTVRYELVPEAEGVFELPPVRFVHFDPTPPAGYRTLETQPIPLVVRAPERSEPPAAPPARADEPGADARMLAGIAALLLGFALAWALARKLRARRARA